MLTYGDLKDKSDSDPDCCNAGDVRELLDRIAELEAENARLTEERDQYKAWKEVLHAGVIQLEESAADADASIKTLESDCEKLAARVQRLTKALRPFAEYYNAREYLGKLDGEYYRAAYIKIKPFRAAAEALKEDSTNAATKD